MITDDASQVAAIVAGAPTAAIVSQSVAHSGELTVFYFVLFFSVMFRRESVKKPCTCETFATVSAGVKYRFLVFFSILFLMTDNLCGSSDIWW